MKILREVEKAVEEYGRLLQNDQENAKEYCKEYIDDIEILINVIEVYINETSNKFQVWCDTSVRIFESSKSNTFLKLKRSIEMKIINHYLNKGSYQLSKAGILQSKLEKIEERFIQYKYFIKNCNS